MTYVTFFGMFTFSFVLVKSNEDVQRFLKFVILSSIVPVLYGLFQTVSGIDWYSPSRIHSTFPHPNMFAFYILAVIGAILFLLATGNVRVSGRFRTILNAYLIPLLVVLVMTKTRSAWVGCLLLFFAYGLVYDKRALVLLLIVPIFALIVPAVNERIMNLETGNNYIGGSADLNSFAWRLFLWKSVLTYIWQQPILGFGAESFHFYSHLFFQLEPKGTYAHNVYIQLLFETGVFGVTAFLWLFWRNYAWLIRHWRVDRRGLAIASGIIGTYLIACFSDNILEYLSFNWCFWFVLGLAFAQQVPYRVHIGSVKQQDKFRHK